MGRPVTEQETLRAEVKELRLAVTGLVHLLDEKVQTKVEAEVRDKTVPREELDARLRRSGRRVVVGITVVVLLLIPALLVNRVTLQQAQRDVNRQVATCFLRPSAATPAQTKACAKRFGPDYNALQQRSRANTADFLDLKKWAKSQGWKPPEKAP
jgi:hypothetical protein